MEYSANRTTPGRACRACVQDRPSLSFSLPCHGEGIFCRPHKITRACRVALRPGARPRSTLPTAQHLAAPAPLSAEIPHFSHNAVFLPHIRFLSRLYGCFFIEAVFFYLYSFLIRAFQRICVRFAKGATVSYHEIPFHFVSLCGTLVAKSAFFLKIGFTFGAKCVNIRLDCEIAVP